MPTTPDGSGLEPLGDIDDIQDLHEGEHVAIAATAPEIWHVDKRVLRTILQALLSGIALVGAIQAVAPDVLDQVKDIFPESWIAAIIGAIAFVAAVAGALSRIMAIPMINTFLTKYLALGSVPKTELETTVGTKAIDQ
jgi:hypothetical protein